MRQLTITDPDSLCVYQLLESVTLSPSDVFIDLGSGVGQVVLQVAATANLKMCIGIERAEVPFDYSQVIFIVISSLYY